VRAFQSPNVVSFWAQSVRVLEHFQAYCSVNREFASRTLQALRKSVKELDDHERFETSPVVWIHDYQLLVAATTIRQVRVTCFAHSIFLI
jgi:trehalose-6-phosphate synthase